MWTDEIQTLAGGRGRFNVRASKGVHIVVARDRINSEVGLILRTASSVLFVIPWGTHWIIGTTDTDWQLDLAHPAATGADIAYILGHVNAVLTEPIGREDLRGVYAGLRPLLSGGAESTTNLSREHAAPSGARGRGGRGNGLSKIRRTNGRRATRLACAIGKEAIGSHA